jgi:hypothetical protein
MNLLTNIAKTASQTSANYSHTYSNVIGVAIASASCMNQQKVSTSHFGIITFPHNNKTVNINNNLLFVHARILPADLKSSYHCVRMTDYKVHLNFISD